MKQRYTILVVDDDENTLKILRANLKDFGYNVIIAHDAYQAFDYMALQLPDLIVSDVILPEMSGHQFCRKIREDAKTQQIPFIFLSTKGKVDDRIEGLKVGADDYITKPFELVELDARIRMIFQRLNRARRIAISSQTTTKGSLSQMSLVDIIGIFEMTQKTGVLALSLGEERYGSVYLEAGHVVHAAIQDLVGEEAFYYLLKFKDSGEFEFTPAVTTPAKTIKARSSELMMEGLRLLDERSR